MAQDRPAAQDLKGSPGDTIAAVATAAGSGALAVVRVCGPAAPRCAAAVLGREGAWPPRQALTAWAKDREGPLDQVVAVYFPAASSPVGEELVELTCHGSPYIQRRLLAALLESGARAALPGEFTQRAFLNGKLDLAQAEAVCDLIRAGTGLAHRSALEQLEGGLSRALAEARRPILDFLVRLEAGLDHPEEDLPALPAPEARSRLAALAEPVERLAGTFGRGRVLREGARICLVGRANAGKSSLLNALLGCERAIVCAEPGTTRDTIEEPCDLEGLPAVLVDTAGLGHPCRGPADERSLERTRRALRASDLALLVVDGSRPLDPQDSRAHQEVLDASAAEGRPVITVLSKADLPASGVAGDCAVSALRGTGLGSLKGLVASRLRQGPAESGEGGAVVTSARHHEALRRCAAALREAAAASGPGAWEELAASRVREALAALDEVTGPAAPDEVLAGIFSRFCVGK